MLCRTAILSALRIWLDISHHRSPQRHRLTMVSRSTDHHYAPPPAGTLSAGDDDSKLNDPDFVLKNEVKEWQVAKPFEDNLLTAGLKALPHLL